MRQKQKRNLFSMLLVVLLLVIIPAFGINAIAQEKTTTEPSATTTVENKDSQDTSKEESKSDNSGKQDSQDNNQDSQNENQKTDNNLLKDKVTESYLLKNANMAYTKADKAELKNLILVKQTLFDGTKLKEDDNLDILNNAYDNFEAMLGQFLIDIPIYNLSDESNYYVAYINTMQDNTNASVRDYEFAKNNDLGEVLDNCIYDKETGIAYIPKSLFTKDTDNNEILEPVQVQLMQVISNNNNKVEDINLKTCAASQEENDETHSTDNNALSNIYDDTVTVQSKPGLDPNNIIVYVNGFVSSPADYEYNSETGQVKVSGSPAIVGNVTVEEATSEQEKQLDEIYPQDVSLKTQELDTSSMIAYNHGGGTLNIPKNTKVGDVIDGSATYYYNPSASTDIRDQEYSRGELNAAYLIKRKGQLLQDIPSGVNAGYGLSFMRWINNGQSYTPAADAEIKGLGANTEIAPHASIWDGYSFFADFNDGNQNFKFQDGRTADLSFLHKVAFSCVHVGVSSQTAVDWMSSVNNGEVYRYKLGTNPDKYNVPMRMRFYKIDGNYAILGVLAARIPSYVSFSDRTYSQDQAGYGLIKVPISKIPSVSFKKTAKSVTGNELEGANFELYEYNNITKTKGNHIKSFTSQKGGVEFTDLEKNKYYYIEEVNAPNGYQAIEPIAFYINNKNEVSFANNTNNAQKIENGDTIVVADKPVGAPKVNLRINKMNILEENLPGAQLQLYKWDPSGEGSSEWVRYRTSVTSLVKGVEIQNIDFPAKYKIVEQTAPKNVNGYDYKIFEGNCFFELDEDGRISKSEGALGDFSVENNLDEGQVILNMVDESTTPLPTPTPQFKVGIIKKSENTNGSILPGAQFEIRETANGSAIDSLASKSSTVYSQKHLKLDKTYYLVEASAPSGYEKLENPIKFHMNSNGNIIIDENNNDDGLVDVSVNVFTIANIPKVTYNPPPVEPIEYPPYNPIPPVPTPTPVEPTLTPPVYNRISLRKADMDGQPLAGSCFEIYDDINKNPIDTLYPGTDTIQSANHLENNHEYTLREKTAPNDYVAMKDIKFKVYRNPNNDNDSGTITIISNPNTTSSIVEVNGALFTIKNELQTHKIKIKKVNSEGERLANAVLYIKRSNTLVSSKTTVASQDSEFDLQAGTYLLHEQTAPRGYETITDFYFSVDSSGNVLVPSSNGNTVKAEGNTLTVTDKSAPYDLTINKVDPNGNPLAGAILQLTNDPELSTQSVNSGLSNLNLSTQSVVEKEEALNRSDANFVNGRAFNAKCYQLAGGLENIVAFERIDEPLNKENVLSINRSCPIYAGYNADKKTIWWSTKSPCVYLNSDSASMFKGMTNLKSLGKGNEFGANAIYVKSFAHAFEDCASLENVNLASSTYMPVYDLSAMFKNCQSLKTVIFPKATEDENNIIYPTNIEQMFEGCNSLETLDLSIMKNIDIKKADELFKDCSSLKTIIVDKSFCLDKGYRIFENTPNLVGGNGTKWTEEHINYDGAFVDNEQQKGYFTSSSKQNNKQESIEDVNLKTNGTDEENKKDIEFHNISLKTQATPSIQYEAHVQNVDWQGYKTGPDAAGKQGNRLEALRAKLVNVPSSYGTSGVTYSTTGSAASNSASNGGITGITGQNNKIQTLRMDLTGGIKTYYKLYLKTHYKAGNHIWASDEDGWYYQDSWGDSDDFLDLFQAKLVQRPGCNYTINETMGSSTSSTTTNVKFSDINVSKKFSNPGNSTYEAFSYNLTWTGKTAGTPEQLVKASNPVNCTVKVTRDKNAYISQDGSVVEDGSFIITVTATKKKSATFNFKYNDNGTTKTIKSGVTCDSGKTTPTYTFSDYVSPYYGNAYLDFDVNATWDGYLDISDIGGSGYSTATFNPISSNVFDIIVTPESNNKVHYNIQFLDKNGNPLYNSNTSSRTFKGSGTTSFTYNGNTEYKNTTVQIYWGTFENPYSHFVSVPNTKTELNRMDGTENNQYSYTRYKANRSKSTYNYAFEQNIYVYPEETRQPADFYFFTGDPNDPSDTVIKSNVGVGNTVTFNPSEFTKDDGSKFNKASISISWDGLYAGTPNVSGCQAVVKETKKGSSKTKVAVYVTREYVQPSNLYNSFGVYFHNINVNGEYLKGAGNENDVVVYKSDASGTTGEQVTQVQQNKCALYLTSLPEGYYLIHQNSDSLKTQSVNDENEKVDIEDVNLKTQDITYQTSEDILIHISSVGEITLARPNSNVTINGNNIYLISQANGEIEEPTSNIKTITWETETEEGKNISLPIGEYTLKEISPPDENYKKFANMKIRVNDDGSISVVEDGGNIYTLNGTTLTITDQYVPHDIIIDKTDMAWRSINGAEIQIRNKTNNQVVETWTSDKDAGAKTISLYPGTYIFHEANKPIGYKQLENDIEFTVTIDGKVEITNINGNVVKAEDNKLTVADDYDGISVMFNKLDIHGKKIAGAELNIVDSNNEVVASWVSEKDKTKELHLPIGTYTFKEVGVPNGYAQIADIPFEVNDEGHIVLPNGETDHISITNNNVLNVIDDYVKSPVEFSKLNTGSEFIEGAKLQILQDDTLISEWTTVKNQTHQVQLFPGRYTFRETEVPDEYSAVTDFTFEVEPGGNVIVENSDHNDLIEGYRKLIVFDKYKSKDIEISKISVSGKELNGVHIQILSKDAPEPLYDYTSSNSYMKSIKLKQGEYTFHEVSAPENYAVTSDIKFKVDPDGNVVILEDNNEYPARAVNNRLVVTDPYDVHEIKINKVDPKGNALEGAHLQIVKPADPQTALVDWTSSTEAKTTSLLPGDYLLHEVEAPTNYTKVADIPFTITEEGYLKITDGSAANNNVKIDGNNIILTNPYAPHDIQLSKIGLNGEKVIGSKLKIDQMQTTSHYENPEDYDPNDDIPSAPILITETKRVNIWSGTSANANNTISLYPGEYIFVEESAPTNYDKVTEFTFEVSVDGKVSIKNANGNTVSGTNDTLSVTDPYVPHDVEVSKINLYGDEIGGAHVQIKQGDAVKADWTSEEGKNKTVSLLPGNYSFVEVSPPQANYAAITTTVDFTVGIDGTVTITALNGNTAEATGSKLSVTDPFVPHNVVFSKINPEGTRLANAEIQIKQGSDVKDSWTTASNQDKTASLLPGDYTFHEETPPTHYLAVKDITFNVAIDGTVTVKNANNETVTASGNKLTVTDPYEPKDIEIKKIDVWNNQIAGAHIQVKQGNDVLADWRTEADKSKTIKLTKGTYTFHEEGDAPSGYLAVSDITFEVSLDGKVTVRNANGNTVTASNNVLTVTDQHAPHDITFQKINPWNERISGVRIQIKQGSTTKADWTTTAGNDKVLSLLPGDYVFHEVSGPSNYYTVSDISFSIDITGKVTVTNANNNTVVGGNGSLTVTDPFKERTISIRKENLAGSRISGAVLQIKDKTTGEVKHEWTSSSSSNKSITILPGTYTFHEVSAPATYKPVADFDFKVDPNANVTVEDKKGNTLSTSGSTLEVTDMIVADISVSKEVQGKLGDGNYEFTYVFTANTSDTYPIVYTKQDGSTVEGTIKGGDTFKLKNHEKAVIKNVVYNTNYSITEKGTNDYRASVSYKGADNRTATASANALRVNPNDVSVGTKVITVTGEEKYEYTNAKDELVPAGINEILLPFALLVFIALIAAVTYVFATKKKRNR